MSINVLDSHPDLLPDVIKLLSTALTTAQDKARALELKLQQQDDALLEAETNVEAITKKYDREREGGDELRAALEQRFIDLRTRETQVEEARRLLEARMHGLKDGAQASHEDQICDECEVLRKTLDSSTQTLRAKDEALSALACTNQELKTALREAQQLDHTRFAEVERLTAALETAETRIRDLTEQIEARDAAMASLREALESSKLDVSAKESSLSTIESAKEDIEKSLKSANIEIIDLTGRVDEKESKIRRLRAASLKLDTTEMQRAASHANEVRLKSEVEDAQSKLRGKATELKQTASQLQTRQSELKLVRDGNTHLRSENTRLIEEKSRLRERNEVLEAERRDIGQVAPGAEQELQRLMQKNEELIKGLQEAFGINEAAVKESAGLYSKVQTQQNRIDELLKTVADLKEHVATLQAENEKQKAEAAFRNSALLQLGDMYNTRNTECAELKEALQRQEQPSPVTTQQTPPPTPPIQSRVFTAHSPPACDKPTVPVTWASLAANYKSKTLAAQDKKTERSQYLAYMSALPQPLRLCRPKFTDHDSVLQPVAKILDGYDVFSISYPNPVTRRDILHCPKRTLWCNQSRIHAIVVEPTHIFSRQTNRYVENHAMTRYCGKNSDRVNFFANKGEFVYYVGTYVVHSLRAVHPPSGGIPSDVSNYAIHNQMGMTEDEVRASSHLLPGGRVGTECFGMQCVGFDQDVYRMLRERFTNSGSFEQHPEQGLKRKAESEEEMRGEREVKLSRFA